MSDDWFDVMKGIRPYGKGRYVPIRSLKGTATQLISAEAYRHTRTAAYIRVSTDEQGRKGLSLPAQVLAVRECVVRLGLPPLGQLLCDVESASDFAHNPRPAWEILKQMVERGEISRLLVLSLDRLSRKGPKEVIPFVYQLLGKNVELIWTSPTEKTPVGNELIDLLLLSIKAEEARQLASNISSKVISAIRTEYLAGMPPSGVVPYGYQSLDGQLVPHAARAMVVKTAYELAMDPALSLRQITKRVNEFAPEGERWDPTRLARLLRNPMMAGFREAPPSLRNDPDLPPLIALQNWEPLVNRAAWDEVQAILAARPAQVRTAAVADAGERSAARTTPPHLLARLGKCAGCKSGLTVSKGRQKGAPDVYVCPQGRTGKCHHTGAVSVDRVVAGVLGLLRDQLVKRPAHTIAAD